MDKSASNTQTTIHNLLDLETRLESLIHNLHDLGKIIYDIENSKTNEMIFNRMLLLFSLQIISKLMIEKI